MSGENKTPLEYTKSNQHIQHHVKFFVEKAEDPLNAKTNDIQQPESLKSLFNNPNDNSKLFILLLFK